MSILIKGMEMPESCEDCRWFYFQGATCTEPSYLLDSRCELKMTNDDWYGFDKHGGWVGEDIDPKNIRGYYYYHHCVEKGTRAKQCPLVEVPTSHGRLIDADAFKEMCLSATREAKPDFIRSEDWVKACAVTLSFCRDIDEAPTIIEAEEET